MSKPRPPSHGFRFSRVDAVVLLAGAGLTWALWRPVGQFALLVPVTLLHFLLFCNVFRVRRGAELLWAGVFVANFAAWALSGPFSSWGVLGIQLPVTLAILVVEVRHPRYHGIFCRSRKDESAVETKAGARGETVTLRFRPYMDQVREWPTSGRHIMAQYDADSIVVFQAFRPSIASHAVEHQRFGGDFGFSRMSWIKPNFLWMMFRSGWATNEGQEHVLALTIPRVFFDEILRRSVSSMNDSANPATRACWAAALEKSDVRIQWDPDHDPAGKRVARRAVQLGLRGATLRRYAEDEIVSIEDITPFVAEQRAHVVGDLAELRTPEERVYLPADRAAALAAGIEEASAP